MSARVVYTPTTHVCDGLSGHRAGIWWYPELDYRKMTPAKRYQPGTVRQCPCGLTWVAGDLPGLVPSAWRREGRIERWMRLRRTQ